MNNHFTYCILSYVHSQLLEEKINVGILFHFKLSNEIVFKHPKNFKRIKELYSDFAEWQLKSYLIAIDDKINKLNEEINSSQAILFVENFNEKIINQEIIRKDATVLRFSEEKHAVVEFKDNHTIAAEYYNLYFSNYNETIIKKEKHDENYLIKNFRQRLFDKKPSVQNLLYADIHITSPKTSVKFDYKWKNGVDNLVKPVGFDLEEESSINHKAILIHGQLNFISEEIKKDNYNIDLIISAPTEGNKELRKAYKQAVEIIRTANVLKQIIEENQIDSYIEKVAKEAKPPK